MAEPGGDDGLVIEREVVLGEDGYPLFVDGDALGGFVSAHFEPPLKGGFHRLGRMRITLRPLREDG